MEIANVTVTVDANPLNSSHDGHLGIAPSSILSEGRVPIHVAPNAMSTSQETFRLFHKAPRTPGEDRRRTKFRGCLLPRVLVVLIVTAFVLPQLDARAAAAIPLVYSAEQTVTRCPEPPLPSLADLPPVLPLPDPFEWSNGRGRSTNFSDWACRRAEIKREIEHYEIGPKPPRPEQISASYTNGVLTVSITVGTNTLRLTSRVVLPAGEGPFPAIIGVGGGSGSLPAEIFSSRNVARIAFNFTQVMSHTQRRGNEPINRLYPELTYMGAYSAWSWGVSRLIDGLEMVQDDLPIDLKRIGITGCSFAGKMALFAGAFDERIALTIAQEPGGGGAAAWRVSETLGNVEKLGATSRAWFIESMFQFAGPNVSRLPTDHHELMAMVAPRALLVLGNPDFTWLAEESGYVSCRAAHEVWKTFGIGDRFGFSIEGGHGHCSVPASQRPEVEAFVEKFLLGNTNANTAVTRHPYDAVDHARWYQWWGKTNAIFPDNGNTVTVTLEAECGTVGTDWAIQTDAAASNGRYITAKAGLQSVDSAPAERNGWITIPFTIPTNGTYSVFARLNCATAEDDSLWMRIDNEPFVLRNGLTTSGWQWLTLDNFPLTAGQHTLVIGYREDGAHLDKISLSTHPFAPQGLGVPAENLCPPTKD